VNLHKTVHWGGGPPGVPRRKMSEKAVRGQRLRKEDLNSEAQQGTFGRVERQEEITNAETN